MPTAVRLSGLATEVESTKQANVVRMESVHSGRAYQLVWFDGLFTNSASLQDAFKQFGT